MSAVASAAGGGAAASRARADASVNPWLIAAVVALATFMEVLDTTIANVALPYIAGGMGVSEDEASWVVTTYLVANAIILTASPFLARMVGRKRFFLICLGVFTAASVLCGFAWNLQSLLFFRILQGLGGGGMVPVSQSILADAFPPEKRGQAFALFGVAVVVAPVVGPTLGGWLSDNVSWHWCFLINGPVGLATMAAIAVLLREQPSAQGRPPLSGARRPRGFAARNPRHARAAGRKRAHRAHRDHIQLRRGSRAPHRADHRPPRVDRVDWIHGRAHRREREDPTPERLQCGREPARAIDPPRGQGSPDAEEGGQAAG